MLWLRHPQSPAPRHPPPPSKTPPQSRRNAVGAITATQKFVKFDVDAAEGLVQNHDYKRLE
jgi:hypothetical protein